MFDWQKPTVEMLGRWQPWHSGHTALFEKCIDITGQVAIMVRDVGGVMGTDAGAGRTDTIQTDNPFDFDTVCRNIEGPLFLRGWVCEEDYIIMRVPNIVDISYGRGVGYSFTEHDLGARIHSVSATKIRAEMRERGELAGIDDLGVDHVAIIGGASD
jgi:hypothetical protein